MLLDCYHVRIECTNINGVEVSMREKQKLEHRKIHITFLINGTLHALRPAKSDVLREFKRLMSRQELTPLKLYRMPLKGILCQH